MLKLVAVDATGKRRKLEAERLEIQLPGGRRLLIDAPHRAWGDLDLQAETESGTPLLGLQPAGCNLLTVRVGALHDSADSDHPGPAAKLELKLQKALEADDRLLARPRKPDVRRWAQAALEADAVVTVRLVGEEEGRSLNKAYRGKDYATNVLTFAYGDESEPKSGDGRLTGDVVLCVPVVVREALEQCKAPEAHYAHLVVHGMLHLQGYDHETAPDAEAMEAREREILGRLGYADPYA
jgi:probable rRNA maturation factor